MTPLAQRIALAKLEGWTLSSKATRTKSAYYRPPGEGGYKGCCVVWKDGMIGGNCLFPDYLDDLNAIHRLEARLQGMQQFDYWCNLGGDMNDSGWLGHFGLVNATAAEKSKAMLKTLGLWDDSL